MPDFERLLRKLELDVAETSEEKAYVLGKHAGQDNARRQIVVITVVCAFVFALCYILTH